LYTHLYQIACIELDGPTDRPDFLDDGASEALLCEQE
jgi:hypothetical protein